MQNNHVTGGVFEKVVVSLNGRIEIKNIGSITNEVITPSTNQTVNLLTNLTVSLISNRSFTSSTNPVPVPPVVNLSTNEDNSVTETNEVPANKIEIVVAAPLTNTSLTLSTNQNVVKGPDQTSTTTALQNTRTVQVTTTTNNLAITAGETEYSTLETNMVVIRQTNSVVTLTTNRTVLSDVMATNYFLVVQYTPPQDFSLASTDSLVLTVDHRRWSFSSTNLMTPIKIRKGFSAAAYRVPAEVLEALASANQASLRLRAANNTSIDKKLNRSSRKSFAAFLNPAPGETKRPSKPAKTGKRALSMTLTPQENARELVQDN